MDSPRPRIDNNCFEETEQDEFLAGHDDVGAAWPRGIRTEEFVRLVHGMRPPGDDQRAVFGIDPMGVADHVHATLGMQAHARDHEHVGDPAVEPHLRRPEIAVPLLQDDPGLVEPGVHHGRADRPDTGGDHPRVGQDERQHTRAMIEGAGDHRGKVVLLPAEPQALPQARQLARLEQFVTAWTSGKLHCVPLRLGLTSPPGRHDDRAAVPSAPGDCPRGRSWSGACRRALPPD